MQAQKGTFIGQPLYPEANYASVGQYYTIRRFRPYIDTPVSYTHSAASLLLYPLHPCITIFYPVLSYIRFLRASHSYVDNGLKKSILVCHNLSASINSIQRIDSYRIMYSNVSIYSAGSLKTKHYGGTVTGAGSRNTPCR